MPQYIADDRDFPPGSDARQNAALSCAGALLNPDQVIEGYGEYDEDYNPPAATGEPKCSTFEETVDYYDQHRPADITILKPKD